MSLWKWTALAALVCLAVTMGSIIYQTATTDCNEARWAFYQVQKSLEYERNNVDHFKALEGQLHGASKTLAASAKQRQYNVIQDLLKADEVVNALCDQPRED